MMWMKDTDDSLVEGGNHRGAVNRNRQASILLALMSVLTFSWAPYTGTALLFLFFLLFCFVLVRKVSKRK